MLPTYPLPVFPTGVGMNRPGDGPCGGARRVPHKRGDEPSDKGNLSDASQSCKRWDVYVFMRSYQLAQTNFPFQFFHPL